MHTTAIFQQDSTEVHIFIKKKNVATTAIKTTFSTVSTFLLYQNETLRTSTGGIPSSQHMMFLWPGTIQTNPIMPVQHGFSKCKKVGSCPLTTELQNPYFYLALTWRAWEGSYFSKTCLIYCSLYWSWGHQHTHFQPDPWVSAVPSLDKWK